MGRRTDSWKQKVHPLFIEGTAAYRDAVRTWQALGPQPPVERIAQIESRLEKDLEAVRVRYSNAQYTPTTNDPLNLILVDVGVTSWPPSQREMDQGFLELLYWKRFKEPLWIALQKANAGDLDALRRVNRVGEDFQKFKFGKGPVKAAKGDPDHGALLDLGLDLGLSALNPEELADCFDCVCPCGRIHDADALKKQRSRKQKALKMATNWLIAERAKMSTREWMAAYGMYGLQAKGVPAVGEIGRRVYVGKVGQLPWWHVDEQGRLFSHSEFDEESVAKELPYAFAVSTLRELFDMFFLSDAGQQDANNNRQTKNGMSS
jgi:hypothetical protein